MPEPLIFGVLGPLQGRRGRQPVDLGPARQRAVLATLLMFPSRVVSIHDLVGAVWDGDPPAGALTSLYSYISNIRRALEPGCPPRRRSRTLQRVAHGYAMEIEPEQLDSFLFKKTLQEGRRLLQQGRPEEAHVHVKRCLSLWRGSPYQELPKERFALREVSHLEELYRTATEVRIEAELALGRDIHGVTAELQALAEERPESEPVALLLMRALCRIGRPAEALLTFERIRLWLADELGVDPGPKLRKLHLSIVRRTT
jgi:DNA-binding SARP family transcriptional activator